MFGFLKKSTDAAHAPQPEAEKLGWAQRLKQGLSRTRAQLSTAFPLTGAWRTDLIERAREPLSVTGTVAQLELRPFQLVTIRVPRSATANDLVTVA